MSWEPLPQRRRKRRPAGELRVGLVQPSYEYLDHTADVQIHAWGESTAKAFENAAIAMFAYMADLSTVDVDPSFSFDGAAPPPTIRVSGHDLLSLLFAFLDELLFRFAADNFVCREVRITRFTRGIAGTCGASGASSSSASGASGADGIGEFIATRCPSDTWWIDATLWGETFDLRKHPRGTEVKAVTYASMQVLESHEPTTTATRERRGRLPIEAVGGTHVYVIIDI